MEALAFDAFDYHTNIKLPQLKELYVSVNTDFKPIKNMIKLSHNLKRLKLCIYTEIEKKEIENVIIKSINQYSKLDYFCVFHKLCTF